MKKDKMKDRLIDGQIETLFLLLLRNGTTLRKVTLASGELHPIRPILSNHSDVHRVAAAVNSSAWSLGSSNLANGLTAGEAIGMVFVGSVLAGLIAFVCGEPGVRSSLHFQCRQLSDSL
jgi:cytosine/uracil/thiamine/allantoin permease